MKRIICTLFTIVMLLGGVSSAQAAFWSLDITGSLSNPQGDADFFLTDDGKDLSWGPAGTANYENRNGIVVNKDRFTFRDNELNSSYGTLTGATLNLTVDLIFGDTLVKTFNHSVDFGYIETPNLVDGYHDNIFYFTQSDYWDLSRDFEYNGNEYYYSFFDTLTNLNDYYGEYVALFMDDPTKQYWGFVLPENDTIELTLYAFGPVPGMQVPTPEPGTVMLMGVGLAGLAFLRRRMK